MADIPVSSYITNSGAISRITKYYHSPSIDVKRTLIVRTAMEDEGMPKDLWVRHLNSR